MLCDLPSAQYGTKPNRGVLRKKPSILRTTVHIVWQRKKYLQLIMISEENFIKRIRKLSRTIPSKTGAASYTAFKLSGNILTFKRVNTETFWSLDIKRLYKIYTTNNFINTTVVKEITNGGTNSPSVAILMAIDCIDKIGNRIER